MKGLRIQRYAWSYAAISAAFLTLLIASPVPHKFLLQALPGRAPQSTATRSRAK